MLDFVYQYGLNVNSVLPVSCFVGYNLIVLTYIFGHIMTCVFRCVGIWLDSPNNRCCVLLTYLLISRICPLQLKKRCA